MLKISADPLRIEWKEELGFAHERQIVKVAVGTAGLRENGWLTEADVGGSGIGGKQVPYQAAKDGSGIYLELEAAPYARLNLTLGPQKFAPPLGWRNTVSTDGDRARLSNGRIEIEVPLGTGSRPNLRMARKRQTALPARSVG